TMFPNPSNGEFVLQMNGLETSTFELNVYDAIGNVVYNKTISVSGADYSETISLNNASAGIYQVSLVNSTVKLNYPIVIQK
ncbi:MAG: T9SS type A sorting domain-containing protein, partial [Chitinophagales bacterium]|nr:T9SS type A sorting domain-containing protein [Chitinophagales bacterium]